MRKLWMGMGLAFVATYALAQVGTAFLTPPPRDVAQPIEAKYLQTNVDAIRCRLMTVNREALKEGEINLALFDDVKLQVNFKHDATTNTWTGDVVGQPGATARLLFTGAGKNFENGSIRLETTQFAIYPVEDGKYWMVSERRKKKNG